MLSLIIAYILHNNFIVPAIFAVPCRKMILRVWRNIVNLLCIAWHAFISVLYLCIASFVVMSLAAGSQGGYFISEYVANHVTPMVCFAILAFAQLFTLVHNRFAVEAVSVSKTEVIHASDIALNYKSFFSAFVNPTPALLQ